MEKEHNTLSRRKFLKQSSAGIVGLSTIGIVPSCSKSKEEPATMPMRTLGKTGLKVSILSFGGGSQFLKNKDGKWEPILERAIESGINYFDTASTYKWSASKSSEQRFGEILPKYRQQIILSTKFNSRDVTQAMKEFEQSLECMKTDYVDILMVHSIESSDDIATFEKNLYKEMVKLKEQGTVKFIGFSCMNDSHKSKDFIEALDFDMVLLAMNPTKYGDFAEVALPAAREKNLGVAAMKVMRNIVGKEATSKELLHYAWTQAGIATAVVGHVGMEILEENIRLAQEYAKTPQMGTNREELETRVAHLAGPHALCWARPDYYDGMMV